jgi:heme/copper-type cytochrome/quinol oxidase subunit 2
VGAIAGRAGTVNKLMIAALVMLAGAAFTIQEQTPNRRDFTIVARDRQFEPNHIEVTQNDLVRVTLTSEKEPRTFAVDAYRISKRVGGGQTITFEFLANQPGTFTFYCNLTSVVACKEMHGTLVVAPK